jgi:phage gp36-like protein
MAYANNLDVSAVFDNVLLAQLTSPSGGSITTTFIDAVGVSQSALMDSYFIGRYVTPITDTTSLLLLKPHCVRLIIAELLGDRLALERYKTFADKAAKTMTWLEAITMQTASLGPGCAQQVGTLDPVQAALAMSSYPQVFGPDPSPNAPVVVNPPTVTIL